VDVRVCDRHRDRPAKESLHIERDDARFDLCAECKTALLSFLCSEDSSDAERPVRRSRQAKNLAQAE
jgi:hypothetical protein